MDGQVIAHRIRCITVEAGVVNVCPECGHVWITDFIWDFSRDPHPELGVINLSPRDDSLFEFVEALQDIAPTVALPCLPSCEEAREAREAEGA